jgi:hypothetical protein
LFEAPGDARAWWPFLEALGAAISPDVRVVTLIENAEPVPFTMLSEAAAQLGIAQSTARTVLGRILGKTGTRRQASLVRLLLSGPAQLRSDARPRSAPRRGQSAGAGSPPIWGVASPI